jgi:hypothetical protein
MPVPPAASSIRTTRPVGHADGDRMDVVARQDGIDEHPIFADVLDSHAADEADVGLDRGRAEGRAHDAPLLARLADDQGAQAAPDAVGVEAAFIDFVDPAVDGQGGRLPAGAVVVREQELGDRLGIPDHLLDVAQQRRAGLWGGEMAVDDQRIHAGQSAHESDGFPATRSGVDGKIGLESGPQRLPLGGILMGDDEMRLGLDRRVDCLHGHALPSAFTVERRLPRPRPPLERFSRPDFPEIQNIN